MEHHFAEVNGVRLHYVAQGDGELVLLVHGFPEFWYEWRALLPDLARDHRAVAPDMRGYNLSDKPASVADYRLPILVEDLRQLVGALGHERCTLVAHDWGGIVAWALAILHPEVLSKLVIVNAPHPGVFQRELRHNPDQQRASAYMTFFRSPQAEQVFSANDYEPLAQAIWGEGMQAGYVTEADVAEYRKAWAQPGALTGGLNYYRASEIGPPAEGSDKVMHEEMSSLADRRISVPTLVIWGMRDTALLPGNLEGLDETIDDLTVRRIEAGTHWVIHSHPDEVTGHIREFLG